MSARAAGRRVVFLVLDGVGAGALPDAASFGDEDANTLGHLAQLVPLRVPRLQELGLGNILPLPGVPPAPAPLALPGLLAERSAGKDSTAGHWEHMGLVIERPFPVYPDGFPETVLVPFREAIGRDVLGNRPASGTVVIDELGAEHMATGRPILYTSADSVFQLAAHVDVVPVAELYEWCEVARSLLAGPHAVSRVIARPFSGEPGAFRRTPDRRDFSLLPFGPTYLDLLVDRGIPVVALGKVSQLFAGRGITEEHKVADNQANMRLLLRLLDEGVDGLLMSNLVDFDMQWGHRNDVDGFAAGLSAFDDALGEVLARLGPRDQLIITADHGTDPTTLSYDHSREYVPALYYPRPPSAPDACYQGFFSDTGATVFAHLTGERPMLAGRPLQDLLPERGWRPYPALWPAARGVQVSDVGSGEAVAAAAFLRERFGWAPEAAVILGSGLDAVAAGLGLDGTGSASDAEVAFAEVPHWSEAGVAGHAGRMAMGVRRGIRVALVRGRAHGYEGLDAGRQALVVRTLSAWGVRHLVITNASGGLDPAFAPGMVAVVAGVLDLQGEGPEQGPVLLSVDPLGTPMMGSGGLRYVAVPGPQYETAAEVMVLRSLGGDVVGMSAAAELRAALVERMRVVVLTAVTNAAGTPVPPTLDAHLEVMRVSDSAVPAILRILDHALEVWGIARPA
jgi:phosphopentomutase